MSQYFKVHSKYPMQVKLNFVSCHHLMSFNLQKSHGSNLMPVSSISSVLGVNSSVFAVRGPNYLRIVMGSAISKERLSSYFFVHKKDGVLFLSLKYFHKICQFDICQVLKYLSLQKQHLLKTFHLLKGDSSHNLLLCQCYQQHFFNHHYSK